MHYEWMAHKRLALAAGVDPQTIADIAARKPTPIVRDDREGLVLALSRTLLTDGRLISADYDRGVAGLGQKGMVDLVGILGYYCLVSLTLNAFELGLPESHARLLRLDIIHPQAETLTALLAHVRRPRAA